MAIRFINRREELNYLQQKFHSTKPELLVFRGRRRIGKTFLLKEFSHRINGLYLLATVTSVKDQLQNFSQVVSHYFKDPLLGIRSFSTWEEFLMYINEHVRTRTAIIIDEYPYLLESQPGLSTILQKYWDNYYQYNPNLFLILNGSALSMMEKETLDSKSPLYGRRTGQWFVAEFNPIENSQFFKCRSLVEAIEWYAISGGVPFYSQIFSRHDTPFEAVEQEVLTYGEVLFEEVEFLLRGEFRNPRSYFPILKAIAQGSRKFGEISSKTGYDRSNLTKYLSVLANLKLIRREVPITEKNPAKSKKGLFFLNDYFMNFWFHYVFPNLNDLETGEKQRTVVDILKPTFDHYISRKCEPIIQQLLRIDFFNLDFTFKKIGRHWDRQIEIDVFGYTHDNSTIIGEIKWVQSPVAGDKILHLLDQKIDRVKPFIKGKLQKIIFSKTGFQKGTIEKQPNILWIDLGKHPVSK